MGKRMIAFTLVIALTAPVFFAGGANEALALSTPQYTPEPYQFTQAATAYDLDEAAGVPAAASSKVPTIPQLIDWNILRSNGTMATSGANNSWATAAVALMNAAGNDGYTVSSLPTGLGNRSVLSSYLMRGNKPMKPAKGIVYIPDLRLTDTAAARAVYLNRIKNAVADNDNKAVAASLYFDTNLLFNSVTKKQTNLNEGKYLNTNTMKIVGPGDAEFDLVTFDSNNDPISPYEIAPDDWVVEWVNDYTVWVYDNPARSAADHTVVIVGWDDTKEISYKNGTRLSKPAEGTNPAEYEDIIVTVKGAFYVVDSLPSPAGMGGEPYWVSYNTLLSGAYYLEGFYDNDKNYEIDTITSLNKYTGLGDFQVHTQRNEKADGLGKDIVKNPLAVSYEYDAGGQTNVLSAPTGTPYYYANVFDVKEGGVALRAVSLFLAGEGNSYEIYLVDDYKNADSLKTLGTLIASGSRPLPGYYTVPLDTSEMNSGVTPPVSVSSTKIITGKKFAIVAKVTSAASAAIPIQAGSTPNGRSFTATSLTSWNDAGASGAVCVKAHAERDIDAVLTGVEIPATKDEDGNDDTSGGFNLINAAPGGSYPIGPALVPANANNALPAKNKWELTSNTTVDFHYERDADGWLKDDNATEDATNGKWLMAPTATPPAGLVWNDKLKLFVDPSLADAKIPTNGKSSWAANKTKEGKIISNYVEQPLTILNALTANATIRASKELRYYNEEYELKVTVTAGERSKTGALYTKGDKGTNEGSADKNDPYELGTFTSAKTIVCIDVKIPTKIVLSKDEHKMKANSTLTLTAKQLDDDDKAVPPRKLKWYVRNEDDNFFSEYKPEDPYNGAGPVVFVDSNGKVTPLRDGKCLVYATFGGPPEQVGVAGVVVSEPCEITVERTPAAGVSLNKKKMTMSTGTKFTLTPSFKPAAASNKKVEWSIINHKDKDGNPTTDILVFDDATAELTGVITAKNAGSATVVAKTADGGYTAECVITVTNAPSVSFRKGKSGTFSVVGAASADTITWDLKAWDLSLDPNDIGVTSEGIFEKAPSGTNKLKVTAKEVGIGKLTAKVVAPQYTADGEEISDSEVVIREQSWNIVSVIPISKMVFRPDAAALNTTVIAKDNTVRKLTLCVDPSGIKAPQTETLTVEVVKPADGTLLDFEWSVKKDKSGADVVTIADENAEYPTGSTLVITANKPGTARITGVNHNSNKKINITVKVLLYPSESDIKLSKATSSGTLEVVVGKNANVKARVTGRSMEKVLTYEVTSGSDVVTLVLDRKGNPNGRLTANKVGTATLIIKAVGPNGKGDGVPITITINVVEKKSKK